MKILLMNHSSRPILIADRSSGKMWSSFAWSVMDARNKEVPTTPVDPNKVLIDDMGGPLTDDVVQIVDAGEKLDYKLARDLTVGACWPSAGKLTCMNKRVFPGNGSYRVSLHYRFAPAGDWDYADKGIAIFTLSPENIRILKSTPPVDIVSNQWVINLQ
jgi:hypothetical protein